MAPHVRFVYSNHTKHEDKLFIPPELGEPIPGHHLTSTSQDNLIELAGRVCYDSMKAESRNSTNYHKHIIEVQHTSVWDHAVFVFEFDTEGMVCNKDIFANLWGMMAICANRPGVSTRPTFQFGFSEHSCGLRLTLNLRALREWKKFGQEVPGIDQSTSDALQEIMSQYVKQRCPLAMQDFEPSTLGVARIKLVPPTNTDETWVSLFFTGVSRGLSHELVRHNYQTGKSQRSTRYCDESESNWIPHPLMRGIENSENLFKQAQVLCADAYRQMNGEIKAKLLSEGVDKMTALKQARGAARGVLGNALETELVFSANLTQWKRMIAQRANPAADAEIREAFEEVRVILCQQFPEYF